MQVTQTVYKVDYRHDDFEIWDQDSSFDMVKFIDHACLFILFILSAKDRQVYTLAWWFLQYAVCYATPLSKHVDPVRRKTNGQSRLIGTAPMH